MDINIKIINPKLKINLPSYATDHSSGLDISSGSVNDIILLPMETKLIPTNLIIEIPQGYEGQVRPRSGLAINHRIGILNSPGTIDSDYRGELKIILTNFGEDPFNVKFRDRIAQLVIAPIVKANIKLTDKLSETDRNSGGFGHTGI